MKEINVDGVVYVEKKEIKEMVEFTGEESIASRMIGKNVIVRSRNEGINIGTVVLADDTGVELKNVRRIWYMKPRDKSVSWYEGVANTGLSDDSKISGIVDSKIIIENYSMTIVREQAYKQIMEMDSNGQN